MGVKNMNEEIVKIGNEKITKEEYVKFMTSRENVMNCEKCPMNEGFDSWQDRKPCGQFRCWVKIHCS